MPDYTGPSERAVGQPFGRMFTVRRSLLATVEATLAKLADDDAADKIPAFGYDGMEQTKVKVQLAVYRSEAT